jgi:hypothetical protein
LEYYYFCDALSSWDEIVVQTCLDQKFTKKGKGLLAYAVVVTLPWLAKPNKQINNKK